MPLRKIAIVAILVIGVLYAVAAYVGDPGHGGGHGSVGPAVTLSPAASSRAEQRLKDLERGNKTVPSAK